MEKLEQIEERLCRIEEELQKVSKHVPFVDSLSESGAVKAISSLNSMFSSLNPMRYISFEEKREIENS